MRCRLRQPDRTNALDPACLRFDFCDGRSTHVTLTALYFHNGDMIGMSGVVGRRPGRATGAPNGAQFV
jgi:hypothetical protein